MKTRHHRKAKFEGGTDDKENISRVPDKWHKAFHLLFGHGNPHTVAKRLNELWIDPQYELVVVPKRPTRRW